MKRRNKKRRNSRKIPIIAGIIFGISFLYLSQHMSTIRLGYILSREKEIYKELSNLKRSLYLEKASLKSPRHLEEVACKKLGLDIGAEVVVRKISVVSTRKVSENRDRIVSRLNRFFGLNSRALAKTSKSKINGINR